MTHVIAGFKRVGILRVTRDLPVDQMNLQKIADIAHIPTPSVSDGSEVVKTDEDIGEVNRLA